MKSRCGLPLLLQSWSWDLQGQAGKVGVGGTKDPRMKEERAGFCDQDRGHPCLAKVVFVLDGNHVPSSGEQEVRLGVRGPLGVGSFPPAADVLVQTGPYHQSCCCR